MTTQRDNPWRERNLEQLAEARRILQQARRKPPVGGPVENSRRSRHVGATRHRPPPTKGDDQ